MTAPVGSRPHVLVVGGGPVGLLCAGLLDAQGLEVTVVEQRTEVQPAPAAHVVNARTFEICRALGVDADALAAACRAPEDGASVRWVSTLTGHEHGAVPFERQHELDALHDVTPTPLRNLSQHRFEPILRDHLAARTAVHLHGGTTWKTATAAAPGRVTSVLEGPDGSVRELTTDWLVGADGARSAVRRWLGVEMEGPRSLESVISIHVRADLRSLVASRPATLYWTTDPAHAGTFVAHDIDRTWVFMHRRDPDSEDLADYTVERCTEIVRGAIGAGGTDAPVAVRSILPWTMTCQTASRYRVGPTFLVGDAAHRFPPTGGLGLNTGAADAHNLAWKLGAIAQGWAGDSLLDTYDAERRPVAISNGRQSLDNAIATLEVPAAIASGDPERIAEAVRRQVTHFDMLGLQLGAAYEPAGGIAVVGDGTTPEAVDDPVRTYVPSTRPGQRLPHHWIGEGTARRSTLDLVPHGSFALFSSDARWADAARRSDRAPVTLVPHTVAGEPAEGALLVRPDQHVAWRARDHEGDLGSRLDGVLAALVG